jgi:hypothetical protein
MVFTDANRRAGPEARTARAKARAIELAPIIREIQGKGHTSLRQIAKALNERGIPATLGGEWTAIQVSRVLAWL